MKNIVLIVLISFIILNVFVAKAQNDTIPVISSWTLTDDYSLKKNIVADTLLKSFQNHNPIFKNSISNSYLGNIGSASISNVFSDRNKHSVFPLMNVFEPYMGTAENTNYVNTHKPFTKLSYSNGGKKDSKEETLEAYHTQNINRYFNFGLKYNLISAKGQYKFQKIVNNAFKIFTSYEKTNYKLYSNININKIKADENGGIINDSLLIDSTFQFTTDIPTVFGGVDQGRQHDPDVLTTLKNFNFVIVQELNLSQHEMDDTLETSNEERFVPVIGYILKYDKSTRFHRDKNPQAGLDEDLYSKINFNPDNTFDSLYFIQISNTLRFKLENLDKKNNYNICIDLNHERRKYSFYTSLTEEANFIGDTLTEFRFINHNYWNGFLNRTQLQSNTSVAFNIYGSKSDISSLNARAKYFIGGYNAADYSLETEYLLLLKKKKNASTLLLSLKHAGETPDYLLQTYYSNYFIWNNDFESIKRTELSIRFTASSAKFETGIDYHLLSNYIYFDTLAIPSQYEKNLSVVSFQLTKSLELWKIQSLNKIVCQFVNNSNYLSLPEIMAYNSTFIKHKINFKLTGGGFLAMLGFDVFYNSKYFSNAYNPALGVFHQQNEKELGNYPYLDVFLNIRLKRTRFFLKYEHVNSDWLNKNYFLVLHYPRNEAMFKVGLSWTFYD